MNRWTWVAATVLVLAAAVAAGAMEDFKLTPSRLHAGDIVVVEATRMPEWGSYAVNPLRFFKWNGKPRAMFGVDVEAEPGSIEIVMRWPAAPEVRRQVPILARKLPEERITVAPEYVEPPAAVLDRIVGEKQRLDQLFRLVSKARTWMTAFQRPIDTPPQSAFGLQRIFNGERRSPHPGVDFRGTLGMPVQASNAGRVVLAEDLYFTGKTVILDHGVGLYTIYGHLSEIAVQVRERVKRGAVLGQVGATGRATGPHLHWGARLLQARVDPMQLLPLEHEK